MAAARSLCKATLLALALFALLSQHVAEAQNNCTCAYDNGVPSWGGAILGLTCIGMVASLLTLCLLPIICKRCGMSSCK